jgi:hypothetical protein
LSNSTAAVPEKVGAFNHLHSVCSASAKHLGQVKILSRIIPVKEKDRTLFIQVVTPHAVKKGSDPLLVLSSIASGPQEFKKKYFMAQGHEAQ